MKSPKKDKLRVKVKTSPKVRHDRVKVYGKNKSRHQHSFRHLKSGTTNGSGSYTKTFHAKPGKYAIKIKTASTKHVKSSVSTSKDVRVKK